MCDQLHHAGRKLKWLLLVRSRPLRYSPPLPLSYAACWSTSGPALIFTNVSIHVTSRTDTQCLCTNQGLQQAAISCLQQSCTAQDLQNAESLVNSECAGECLSIFAVVPVPISRLVAAPHSRLRVCCGPWSLSSRSVSSHSVALRGLCHLSFAPRDTPSVKRELMVRMRPEARAQSPYSSSPFPSLPHSHPRHAAFRARKLTVAPSIPATATLTIANAALCSSVQHQNSG